MKHIFLLLTFIGLTFASCKKDRMCKCVTYTTTKDTMIVVYETFNTKNQTRKQAENGVCASYTSSTTTVDTKHSCFLK